LTVLLYGRILTKLQDGAEKKEGETTEAAAATDEAAPAAAAPATTEVQPLSDITNKINTDENTKTSKTQARPQRERRERGPPADGVPSKTKVMVANLPYDLTEDKVSGSPMVPFLMTC
jgi:hypothetical protein